METFFSELFGILIGIAQTSLCWTSRFGNYQPDIRGLKSRIEKTEGNMKKYRW